MAVLIFRALACAEVHHPTFRAFIESEILSNLMVGWSPSRLPLTS
jgi:hypothetical protein